MKDNNFFVISRTCNNNCISCPVSRKLLFSGSTSLQEFKEFIAKHKGLKSLGFTGGEPTINKDFFKMLSYAREEMPDTEIDIITNCRLFSYKEYAKKLNEIGTEKILICPTLYGHNPGLHDAITRTPGSFEQTVNGINNLLELGFIVELRVVINKINYPYLEEIASFILNNLGRVNHVSFISMKMTGEAEKNKEQVCCQLAETLPYVLKAASFLRENQIRIKLMHFPLCTLPEDYWRDATGITAEESEITFAEQCKDCILRGKCSRIWESYLKSFGSAEFKPVKKASNMHKKHKNIDYLDYPFYEIDSLKAAYIHASDLCNFRCKICKLPVEKKKSVVPLDILKKKVEKAVSLGLNNIIFTGQEVILHPNIDEIIRFSFEKCNANYITFNTNGLAFANDSIWKKLDSARQYLEKVYIAISVNFYDAKTFADWSGHKEGMFKEWCDGFKKALDKNINPKIDIILRKDADIIRILEFLRQISDGRSEHLILRVLNLLPLGYTCGKVYESLKYSLFESEKKMSEILSLHKGRVFFESFPVCLFSQRDLKNRRYIIYNFRIDYQDDILIQYDPNIYETYYPGKTENWNINKARLADSYSRMFCYIDECTDCYYKGECYGLQREYLKFNKEEDVNKEISLLKKKNWK